MWVANYGHGIFMTSNSGANWNWFQQKQTFTDLYFPNINTGWGVGLNGLLVKLLWSVLVWFKFY